MKDWLGIGTLLVLLWALTIATAILLLGSEVRDLQRRIGQLEQQVQRLEGRR